MPSSGPASGSDEELVRAWRAGDAEAANGLMQRYYARVLRFFELRATLVAHDLTQKTFLACVEAQANLRDEGAFRSFLFGIAHRQLLRWLRDRDHGEHLVAPEPTAPLGTSLSTVYAQREEQRLLLQALVSLPVELATVMGLYYWEGLKAREIGEALGMPTSTVTTRLASARATIRETVLELGRPSGARQALLDDVEGWMRSLVHA